MAVAYASLVSLMTVIDQIQHHPSPPVTLDDQLVESLRQNITFLQDFLEFYSHGVITEAADELERRIAEAAYAAEDVIESRVVDQILGVSTMKGMEEIVGESTSHVKKKIDVTDHFYQSLQKVVHDFDFIKKQVMEIIKERPSFQDHQLRMRSIPVGFVKYPSKGSNMVGFEDILLQVLDKLTGHESSLLILPIVGMGGIGKTTLARNVFENQLIAHHFDIHSWVTISQEYNIQKILLELLSYRKNDEMKDDLNKDSEEELGEKLLGEKLYKSLYGRRFFIIMDDVWSIEVWNKVRYFFPNDNSGSRIMITTRMSNVASQLNDSHILKLSFLDEDLSWELLCKSVFGKESCPVELEAVGRKITENCKGLPLSIAVISGLLIKVPQTREYWAEIAENLRSILHLEDDERCIRILRTSYDHLPIYLKPCFLYMGVFFEDNEIEASTLVKLWIAEGFLKPISDKSLEVVAEEYLMELVDRNLILVKSLKFDGKIKLCQVHDLLREVCSMEFRKENFIHFIGMHNLGIRDGMNAQRRIVYNGIKLYGKYRDQVLDSFQSALLVRSLIGDFYGSVPQLPFRLLRILKMVVPNDRQYLKGWSSHRIDYQPINMRFFCADTDWLPNYMLSSSMHLYWNLQTLIINVHSVDVPLEIWKMHQLRHVKVGQFYLSEPPFGQDFHLWNLQYLSSPVNFKFSDEAIQGIPNIKRLKSFYKFSGKSKYSDYCINNLCHLQKLESLTLKILKCPEEPNGFHKQLNLPHSLKKLSLTGSTLRWEDVTTKIGSLPFLQVLKLHSSSAKGSEWNLVEGNFCSLKILEMHYCRDLVYWVAESIHFPCLEHIRLRWMRKLKEIPSSLGDIPSLQCIDLVNCGESITISAKKIHKEQEDLGNFDLTINIQGL